MIFFYSINSFFFNLLSVKKYKEYRNKLNKIHAKTSTLNEDLNK